MKTWAAKDQQYVFELAHPRTSHCSNCAESSMTYRLGLADNETGSYMQNQPDRIFHSHAKCLEP